MLTVYKASAGSGKTFRLATENIKRLIVAPTSHEGILAVTFTNKATDEMKTRILSQLYGLAHALPDSQAYLDILLAELPELNARTPFTTEAIDPAFVRRRAAYALRHLLHHYTFFRVETIDRFFQRILRNLARELDLARQLRVELKDTDAVDEAVDIWIDSLAPGEKGLEWIMDYVATSMDDDKAWNVIGSIKRFSRELLDDDYKGHSEALNTCLEAERYDVYHTTLTTEKERVEAAFRKSGALLWDIMQRAGLDETSLSNKKKGVGGFMKRMATESIATLAANAYVMKCLDPDDTAADAWVTKKAPATLRALCRDLLKPELMRAMEGYDEARRRVRSIALTLQHLSKLRMLRAIQAVLEAENREQDRFLLSDTQMLLHRMIAGSDSPFIYEKTGSRLTSIMIDEFQDTSSVQWQNFKVLLSDCMSHGYDNLIVGDVKQSIYRWRKGDWRLLGAIESEFPRQPIEVRTLDTNFRSSTNVIAFNNAFFRAATQVVCDGIRESLGEAEAQLVAKAYSDVEQKPKPGRAPGGYVEVRLVAKDEGEGDEATLDYVASTIARLIAAGTAQSDIAVIVRTNENIKSIVSHCTRAFRESDDPRLRAVQFISDEAYVLSASPAVTIIIDALRLLATPADPIARARLAASYYRHVLGSERSMPWLMEHATLPEAFTGDERRLRSMPLYQLCEEIYRLFSLARLSGAQGAYVCAFLDGVSEFLQHYVGDIATLLDYWDETLSKKDIETPAGSGIRILTIHKSKGLEYDNVILPFCDWQLEIGSPILWCVPGEAPMSRLPVVPIAYAKGDTADTIYERDYLYEHSQNDVDNLNLLYVAFTRAARNLFIVSRDKGKSTFRGALLRQVLPVVAETLGQDYDDKLLAYGELQPSPHSKDSYPASGNVFLSTEQPLRVTIHTSGTEPEFRESNKSQEFLNPTDGEDSGASPDYIALGNAVHYLLSTMRTVADLPRALSDMEMSGMLSTAGITRAALREAVVRGLSRPEIAEWFSPRWKLHNECTILEPLADGGCREHRPDRVMMCGDETVVLDFKLFRLRPEHAEQVRRYMRLLETMGHKRVRGFLWAVMSGEVKEV